MEYTKGEWYLEEETGLILSIPEGSDSPVSIASIGGNQETLTPKPLRELEANARLISASPDLYKAVRIAWQYILLNKGSLRETESALFNSIKKANGGNNVPNKSTEHNYR